MFQSPAPRAAFLMLILALSGCGGAQASEFPVDRQQQETQRVVFSAWLSQLRNDAIAAGISKPTVDQALASVTLDDRVIARDQNQPETTQTFSTYSAHTVSSDRIAEGRAARQQYAAILQQIYQQFGVPPEIVIALWAVESNFGRNKGNYQIVNSLATLAYESHRGTFFRDELLSALRILDEEHMDISELRGSWAGALGQCQFIPSTYLHYAVDYDKTGHRDIWNDQNDVFASIANYLAAEGWRPNSPWGFTVLLSAPLGEEFVGFDHKRSLSQWSHLGVKDAWNRPLPEGDFELALIRPDNLDGQSFLVYDNFRAILRWNHSTYFAASVGLLADSIARN